MLELTRSHVRLRLRVAAFATETGRELLSRALSSYFGSHCMVEFEVGDVAGGTVAERAAAASRDARVRMEKVNVGTVRMWSPPKMVRHVILPL